GFLISRSLTASMRCRFCRLLSAALICAGLSLLLEYLQAHLPGRVPAASDLILNSIGGLTGALLASVTRQGAPFVQRMMRVRNRWIVPGTLADLGLLVLAFWALSQLSPLVPSLDIGNLRHGIKPLWHALFDPGRISILRTLEYLLGLAAIGVVIGSLLRIRSYSLQPFILFSLLVLLLKVPVLSRQLSAEAVLGLLGSILLLLLLQPLSRPLRTGVAACALIGAVLAAGLFEVPGADPATGFNWVPFRAHLTNNLIGIIDILGGLWPFLALSYLALLQGKRQRRLLFWIGTPLIFLFTFALEWHQQTLPGRSADITDALLALLAWLLPLLYVRRHTPGQMEKADATPVSVPAFPTAGRSRWTVISLLLFPPLVFGLLALVGQAPIEQGLDESRQPLLPAPEALPDAVLPGFRSVHPRLPAPTPGEIARLREKNRGYLAKLQRGVRHPKAPFDTIILYAYLAPGTQDLDALYQRLMKLKISWRGHAQAKPVAMAYDWLYDQWSPEQRRGLRDRLANNALYLIDRIRRKERLSPYNVYLYNSPLQALMATAIALYRDDPRGGPVMNFLYDYWKNRTLPVWRQVMGNNGGWHEGGEYVGIGIGQAVYQLPAMWRRATGEDLFATEPAIRGFLDFLVYRIRPDGTQIRWGDAAYFDRDAPDRIPLAIEYRDRGAYSTPACPSPYRPSSWPWGPLTDPALCDPEAIRNRPLQRLFDGIGLLVARSSWDRDATFLTFKAGDNFWSHSHLDQGAFTLFKGAPLAIDSGLYGPRYGADHHMNYTYQSVAHNLITVTDPADRTPTPPRRQRDKPREIANDGGQRRIGSGWGIESAPLDRQEWEQKRDIYHTGRIERYLSAEDL
ncbi:MAG TPA: DUF4962 domain-containing protein, partial [Sedimenticola sp.]|nr:DUF4962 domain-containing protein [Sedimenticola sp.]